MANPETVITSMRVRCTEVLEALQENLDSVQQDKDDFIDELGMAFFSDWFNSTSNYDMTFQQLADAIEAMQTLKTTFDQIRPKLQIARIR